MPEAEGRTLSPTHREALLRTATLAGWAARPQPPVAQALTTEQVDAISHAAANAVLDRLIEWGDVTAPARTPS